VDFHDVQRRFTVTTLRCVLTASLASLAAACAGPTPSNSSGVDVKYSTPSIPTGDSPQLKLKLASGTYRCEQGYTVDVRRDPQNAYQIEIGWQGSRYGMLRNASYSGLPRYENRSSGLVWIDLPWKGVLLDSNTGRQLANECRASS
jgi:hypothetical protein